MTPTPLSTRRRARTTFNPKQRESSTPAELSLNQPLREPPSALLESNRWHHSCGVRMVSRFTKSWSASVFREILRTQSQGYDDPQIVWGTLETPAVSTIAGPPGTIPQTVNQFVRLRLATNNLPTATVRKINNKVQYSSHVVNLVVDNFHNTRLTTDSDTFNFVAAAKLFYQYFPDVYDGLSFVLARDTLASYAAFHQVVRNQISGIGLTLRNQSGTYGSGGKLKAIEIYRAGHIGTNGTSNHEGMHQWADYFELAKMAGYTPAGHQPSSHMSLLFPRQNYVGAVLDPERRVRRVGGDVYRIQLTPSPIKQHPLHLYAMGKGSAAAVPNLVVFQNQGQFGDSSSAPAVSTLLLGGSSVVTMNDIIAQHGQRSGPGQAVWRRAVILISVGALATQKEMNYWNFLAKRGGEAKNTTSYVGEPSFSQSNSGKMKLKTHINVRGRPRITKAVQTIFRNYAATDWRGVRFDRPVPSRFVRNKAYTFSGQVTVTDRAYNAILILLSQADGTTRRLDASISGGRFSATGSFPKKGNWMISVILFYPGSGAQFPVTAMTGMIVT